MHTYDIKSFKNLRGIEQKRKLQVKEGMSKRVK